MEDTHPRKQYVYVQCYKESNGDPSFRGCFVKAINDEEAYTIGGAYFDYRGRVPLINDWVLEVPMEQLLVTDFAVIGPD